ncbi:MAG: ABC transporter permease subunit [Candidatus Riflebacteria bacterium]|nr:ABC transporter permease subunit [Candidatus Riflebacteria bacterium]
MKILAILKKELQIYFFSPIAYIVFSSFLFILGYLFTVGLLASRMASLQPLLGNAGFILLLVSPVLTMRLISEERRSNSIELLLTSPISAIEVVIGKFLGCFTIYLVLIFFTLQYPLILSRYSQNLDVGPIYSGYIGLVLLCAAYTSLGLFASALTQNQIIAAMLSYGGLLIFWIFGFMKYAFDNPFGEFLSKLSLLDKYQDFLKGVVDSGDVIFFMVFTIIWLFLATRVLESERWR